MRIADDFADIARRMNQNKAKKPIDISTLPKSQEVGILTPGHIIVPPPLAHKNNSCTACRTAIMKRQTDAPHKFKCDNCGHIERRVQCYFCQYYVLIDHLHVSQNWVVCPNCTGKTHF